MLETIGSHHYQGSVALLQSDAGELQHMQLSWDKKGDASGHEDCCSTDSGLIETANGTVVRVLSRRSAGAGAQRLQWNGRGASGGLAYGGSYRLHVSATNSVGRADLYAPFTARR